MYIPLIVSIPDAVGVKVTKHVPATKVQLAALKVPLAVVVKLTEPLGVIAPAPLVSVTVAVQVEV